MADTADHRVQNRFLFTAPYISMGRLYYKMAAVFMNYVMIFTLNDVIEKALWHSLVATHAEIYQFIAQLVGDGFLRSFSTTNVT